jgi:hypothetical protein
MKLVQQKTLHYITYYILHMIYLIYTIQSFETSMHHLKEQKAERMVTSLLTFSSDNSDRASPLCLDSRKGHHSFPGKPRTIGGHTWPTCKVPNRVPYWPRWWH